jgi:acyl-CoA thioesterase-1
MKFNLFRFLFLFFLTALVVSCKEKATEAPNASEAQTETQVSGKIVAFGDSLTAGLGLPLAESYPAFLQKLLDEDGFHYEVVNAGVSGDTTTGGLQRINWTLDAGDVKVVILELGGNDILRGIEIDLLKKNLAQMIERIQSRGVTVILAGIEAPTNSGPEYREEVHRAYRELADQYKVSFIPFFLEGIVGKESLIQEDGTHLTKEGNQFLARNVYKILRPLLGQAGSVRTK